MSKPTGIIGDALDLAVSIEKDIPSRIGGANRIFIRAVIARTITVERERAVAAERERCLAVANERTAQLWAAIQLPNTDETKAGWAGQMIEALLIEQRITQGHTPKQSINIEGLHGAARKAGFVDVE